MSNTAVSNTAPSKTATSLSPDLAILYVADVEASRAFYAGLLGRDPLFTDNGFAMFRFDSGLRLGLWNRAQALPAPRDAGGTELAVLVPDRDAVRALHRDWSAQGVAVLQEPVDLDFGFTFVAADPDGHRLRVYAREEA